MIRKYLNYNVLNFFKKRYDFTKVKEIFMKKTLLILFFILSLAVSPAFAESSPLVSDNIYHHNYHYNWSDTVKSYLYEENDNLIRVEYKDGAYFAEKYDKDFNLISSQKFSANGMIWGGFFAGKNYNFIILGNENKAENDSAEVIKVIKYDKSWQKLDEASLHGINTIVPFDAGSLRCTENGNTLYIRTCHQMYTSSDGLNHQANMTIRVNQSTMSLSSDHEVSNYSTGYVSHSFNQYALTNKEGKVVFIDHGDAYPRAICLKVEDSSGTDVLTFPGETGNNFTGAELGGLCETDKGYLVAYTYNGFSENAPKNVYLSYVDKSGTNFSSENLSLAGDAGNPFLVPLSLNKGIIMWNDRNNKKLNYASYNSTGQTDAVKTIADAPLSDCQPIVSDGKVIWYTTDNSIPSFYSLDPASGKITKSGSNQKIEWSIGSTIMYIKDIDTDAIKNSVDMGAAPFLHEGRTMIPMRYVAEALGYEVEWNQRDETAILFKAESKIIVFKNQPLIITPTGNYETDVMPQVKNGRMFLSISNISNALNLKNGNNIMWTPEQKIILIP